MLLLFLFSSLYLHLTTANIVIDNGWTWTHVLRRRKRLLWPIIPATEHKILYLSWTQNSFTVSTRDGTSLNAILLLIFEALMLQANVGSRKRNNRLARENKQNVLSSSSQCQKIFWCEHLTYHTEIPVVMELTTLSYSMYLLNWSR